MSQRESKEKRIQKEAEEVTHFVFRLILRGFQYLLNVVFTILLIGMIAGSNRGIVRNCTTTGFVTDSRTTLPTTVYVGTLVGRNNNSTPAGTVASGTNLLTATAGSSNSADKVEGITSKMGMDFAELSAEAKNAISHRGRALELLAARLTN